MRITTFWIVNCMRECGLYEEPDQWSSPLLESLEDARAWAIQNCLPDDGMWAERQIACSASEAETLKMARDFKAGCLVEDNAPAARAVEKLLGKDWYQVVEFSNPHEGVNNIH